MFFNDQVLLKTKLTNQAEIQACCKMSNDFRCNCFCQLTNVIPCFKEMTHCLK